MVGGACSEISKMAAGLTPRQGPHIPEKSRQTVPKSDPQTGPPESRGNEARVTLLGSETPTAKLSRIAKTCEADTSVDFSTTEENRLRILLRHWRERE